MLAALTLSLVLVAANHDATAYLDQIERRITIAWRLPSGAEGLKVSLRFNLARNGRVSKLRVEKSSGNANFDFTAVEAVRHANPFPRPPKSFPIGDLRIVLEPTNPDRHNESIIEDEQTIRATHRIRKKPVVSPSQHGLRGFFDACAMVGMASTATRRRTT